MFSFVSYLIQQRHIQNPVEHNNGAFWLKKLTAFPESLFSEVASMTQPAFTCSKSAIQT